MAEKVKKLSVKFEGDSRGLNTAIKEATASFNDISKATDNLQKQFDNFGVGDKLKKQQQMMDSYAAGIKAAESALKDLYNFRNQLDKQDPSNKLTNAYQQLETKIQQVKQRLAEFKEGYEQLSNSDGDLKKISATFESVRNKINESNDRLSKTQTYIEAVNKALTYSPDNVELLRTKTELTAQQMATLKSEIISLSKNLNTLNASQYASEFKQEILNVSNALEEAKSKYQELKIQTVEYQEALKKASQLASDIANRGGALKSALDIDPKNTQLLTQYQAVLKQEIEKSYENERAFNKAIESLDSKNVSKTSQEYINLTTGLTNAKKQTSYLREEQEKYTKSFIEFSSRLSEIKSTLSSTSKTADVLAKSLQLDPTSTQKQQAYTEYLGKAIEECKDNQIYLNNQLKEMDSRNVEKTSEEYIEVVNTLNSVVEKQQEYQSALNGTKEVLQDVVSEEDNAIVRTADFNTELNTIHQTLQRLSNSLGNFSQTLFDNAQSYESNIASIQKVVTDLSEDTVNELKRIAIESGTTFDAIAEYATLGATLGIAQNALADFTDAMVKLETASDGAISGEEGAKAVARLLNQFDIGAEYAENFGSAVTFVGDQFAATANEILETASRMGGLSAINNVTINDLIGLASEMKNLGIETESGASAISKAFLTIENQVETSGSKLETFASTAGMTSEEFQKAWNEAPTDAFLSFVNGLSTQVFDEINEAVDKGSDSLSDYASALDVTTDSFKALWQQDPTGTFEKYKDALGDLEEGSESASVTLNNVSLSGVRVAQTLLKLAGNGDVVRTAIEDSSKAWEENTNLTNKANKVYETTEKKLESAKEALRQAAASLGDTFLPLVKSAADVVTSLAKTFNSLPSGAKKAIASTTLLATGLVKVGSSAAGALSWLNQMSIGSSALSVTCGNLLTTLTGGGGLVAAIGSALPVALGIAGVALLAYAGYQAYANRETVQFDNLVKQLEETSSNNLVLALRNINTEMVDVNQAYENLNNSASALTLNPDGTINTTSAEYQQLQSDIATLNTYMGSNFIAGIDSVTGGFVNQKGEIVDVRTELENLRAEKERQAYLEANQDQYNAMLEQQSEYVGKMADKFSEIKQTREEMANSDNDLFAAFSEQDWENFNAVQVGYKDISEFSGTAKSNIEQMQSLLAETPLLGQYEDIKDYAEILGEAQQFIDQYNKIDTAPIEEVSSLINELTSDEKQINIQYNAENIDSIKGALNEVNTQLDTLQQMNAMGFDTTNMQAQYDLAKQAILEDLQAAYDKQKEFDGAIADSASNIDTQLSGEDGAFARMASSADSQVSAVLLDLDKIKNYGDIHQRVYIDTYYRTFGTATNTSSYRNSGSGGFNGGVTMPNLSIPKLSSGGYGRMVLKANFTINNNGDNITQQTSEKIGKQIVNFINEELGGLI